MGWLDPVLQAGAQIVGSVIGSNAADDATEAQLDAAREQIGYARETRDIIRGDQEPYREAGYSALQQLLQLTGVPVPQSVSRAGAPGTYGSSTSGDPVTRSYMEILGRAPDPEGLRYYQQEGLSYEELIRAHRGSKEYQQRYEAGTLPPSESPGRGSRNYKAPQGNVVESAPQQSIDEMVKTDPSYEFRLGEGMRALERSKAASGGLLSGGTARGITRYAQDYASTEYGKIYDRIANIAGLGQTGAAQTIPGVVATGNVMSNAASQAGYGRASGYVAKGNQWANAFNELAKIDWGGVFNRAPAPSYGPDAPYDSTNPYV